jgi:hypothetical protein
MGAGTARLLARIGPKLIRILADYGQNVTVSRAGQPDLVLRAYLYQLDDKATSGDVSKPEFRMQAWSGVFGPELDAQGHFAVRDAAGRLFVPDSDPQDAGTQGAAWIVHLLPADERVRVDYLRFQTPGVSVKDDRTGNIVHKAGPLGDPLSARLVATTDVAVRDLAGADRAETTLIGRWGTLLSPALTPDGVGWGSAAELTLGGRAGVLTLRVAYPDPDVVAERHLGSRFVGVWRAS